MVGIEVSTVCGVLKHTFHDIIFEGAWCHEVQPLVRILPELCALVRVCRPRHFHDLILHKDF